MKRVPAWRVAWFHPARGRWSLSAYEYLDRDDAELVASFLPEWTGGKSALIECATLVTDHGVNG
jgi:hypothetical protein